MALKFVSDELRNDKKFITTILTSVMLYKITETINNLKVKIYNFNISSFLSNKFKLYNKKMQIRENNIKNIK